MNVYRREVGKDSIRVCGGEVYKTAFGDYERWGLMMMVVKGRKQSVGLTSGARLGIN